MIIQSIEMNNFRQYVGKQKIEFSTDKEKNVTVLKYFGKDHNHKGF